jgi:anti-sigma B factor antagonist
MNFVTTEAEGVTTAMLPGRALDASNAGDFKAAASSLVRPNVKLVFDMGNLDFVDSTGLGALVSCLRQAHADQGEIKLCRLRKPVRALFELVRMHRVFEIFNSSEEAVRSYSS